MENISDITKEKLTGFEADIVRILRKKNVKEMEYPGSITIHFNSDKRPVSLEKREIRA